jgi:photosystem I subunit X
LFTTTLLAAVATAAPRAAEWSPTVGLIMIVCNILAIAIGRLTIQQPSVGPAFPAPIGLSVPAFIGSTCLGHVLGAGVILGLSNIGAI